MHALLELVQKTAEYLRGKGIANGRREAEWIFAETLGVSRLDLYLRHDMPVDEAKVAQLRALVQRRGHREPLAYVLGTQPFHGLRLQVTPVALVPRMETEELVDLCLADLPPPAEGQALRFLDVGTGSGAIALACKAARPDMEVHATEVDAKALALATANAVSLGLEVHFHQGHLADALPGPWDRVTANLPYIGLDERRDCDPELAFEPAGALYCGSDGMGLIRALLAQTPGLLASEGVLWLEHGFRQAPLVAGACQEHGLRCTLLRDSAKMPRFARITLEMSR